MGLKIVAFFSIALLAQSCISTFASPNKQKQLKITNVTPSGENVPVGQQIVFR